MCSGPVGDGANLTLVFLVMLLKGKTRLARFNVVSLCHILEN